MAQSTNNGWNAILSQTQTQSDDWTAITEGSTTGLTLGATGTTTYYYVTGNRNFSNTNAGGSGLKIQGTVYLYLPAGLSITCVGANASGATGAGAGIELASGNTLYIIGGAGTVTATGGNAANGSDGGNGTNATGDNGSHIWTGAGGNGGNGGGGAGAGIGTRGGAGGNGGSGGSNQYHTTDSEINGTNGSAGNNGSTAGAMGALYVENGITVNATGGSAASSGGAGGVRGYGYVYDGYTNNDSAAGGGGGGGGGFGGAAANIGTGGPGGGGGGGGAGGSQDWRSNSSGGVYNVIANGGSGGTNADDTAADNGATAIASEYYTVEGGSMDKDDWHGQSSAVSSGNGGSGGGKGGNASGGGSETGNLEYTITYHWAVPDVKTTTVTYSPSTGASVILPKNNLDGYQWALGVYGKDCHVSGDASEFTTASKEFYGGNIAATANRTIYLKDVYGNLDFYEVKSVCMLKNSGDNTQEIGDFFVADNNPNANAPKWPITVRLQDRTLYKDSHWNTICLPFGMTKDQVSASPLAGATIKKLNTEVSGYYPSGQVNKAPIQDFNYGHPVVLFWFDDVDLNSENLVAGKPYLVKWEYGKDLVDDTSEPENSTTPLHQLDFNYVTVKETTAGSWVGSGTTSGNVNFVGTFSSTQLQGGNHKTLILGADDTLYYPSTDLSVAACRGFFTIPGEAANARQIVLGFGDGETTSIIATLNDKVEKVNDNVYNLNGQRLNVLQKGINIVNGKKVVIK